jgi:predicted N-acetyltransferase YhbS
MDTMEGIKLRVLTSKDLDAITEIDNQIFKRPRRNYWETKLAHLETASAVPSIAAEEDGKVIGFILGSASGWEYGISESVGYIDTIAVLPQWQGKGISQLLLKEMLSMLKKVGLETVHVYVNWKHWDLLRFFDKAGFTRGEMVNLEKSL